MNDTTVRCQNLSVTEPKRDPRRPVPNEFSLKSLPQRGAIGAYANVEFASKHRGDHVVVDEESAGAVCVCIFLLEMFVPPIYRALHTTPIALLIRLAIG